MGKIIYGYGTTKGQSHIENKTNNQDAYKVKVYSFGTVLVVSDGLGSHPHSDIGSKAVCKAVMKAVNLWICKKDNDIRLLIPLLHAIWNIEIAPYGRNECGATCLVAIICNDGRIYIGQLGDGDIFLYINNRWILFHEKKDDFANITVGINSIRSFTDWRLGMYESKETPLRICMMTDGVSETLIPEKKEEFIERISVQIEKCKNLGERNDLIYKVLKNWGKVNCGDDRTMVYYERK